MMSTTEQSSTNPADLEREANAMREEVYRRLDAIDDGLFCVTHESRERTSPCGTPPASSTIRDTPHFTCH
jgi:hypothetical protein